MDVLDAQFLSRLNRACCTRGPDLTVGHHSSGLFERLQGLRVGADHFLPSAHDGPLSLPDRDQDGCAEEHPRRRADGDHQRHRDLKAFHIGIEQYDRADDKRDHAGDAYGAKGRRHQLRDHERDAEQDQRGAGVVHRQHLKSVERQK